MAEKEWPLYEVFIRSKSGLSHRHAGSIHAEGVSIWVVRSSQIVASDPAETAAFFEPAEDKIYRHPTFYDMPDGVENL